MVLFHIVERESHRPSIEFCSTNAIRQRTPDLETNIDTDVFQKQTSFLTIEWDFYVKGLPRMQGFQKNTLAGWRKRRPDISRRRQSRRLHGLISLN